MAGTSANASLWTDADVYIAPLGTTGPIDVTTAYAVAWKAVGLLDGEEGLTMSRDEDTAEHYAWGGILVKKTRSKHKRTIKFVAMEDNATVFSIVNPGSTQAVSGTGAAAIKTSGVKVPKYTDFAISFELRDGTKTKRRTVKRATIEEIGEISENETDMAVYEITVVIYPESDGTLFTEIENAPTV